MKSVPFLVLGAVSALFATSAIASPFYRETFKLCSALETSSKNAMDIAGWKAFRSGSAIGKVGFLKVNTPGASEHPLAYNSSPVGPEEGAAFWSKNATGLTVFTDELSFDVSQLSFVQYQQRLAGYDTVRKQDDGSKLALLIGSTWYISDQTVRQGDPGIWEVVSLDPRQLTYGTVPNLSGKGPEEPENFNIKLPSSGIVSAFGVFIPKVTGKVRIDNFTLSDASLDLRAAGEQGSASQCAPVRGPGPERPGNGGSTPSGETPQATPTPGGPSVPAVKGVFCEGVAAHALGTVSGPSNARKSMLLGITGKTLVAARDRAIIALLTKNNLRIDNLVNVTVADYYSVGTLQVINASGVTKQTKPVRRKVKFLIDEYLERSGLNGFGSLPLFPGIDKKTGVVSFTALCTNNLRAIVKRRARAAKVLNQIKINS